MKLILFSLMCYCLICYSNTAKILGIFPSCGYSQFLLGGKLMRELAARGHEVTVISAFPTKTPIKNYKDVPVREVTKYCQELDAFGLDQVSHYAYMKELYNFGYYLMECTFQNEGVQQLLNLKTTFDVVICELFVNYAEMALAHHFNASLILLSSQSPNEWSKNIVRHPMPFTYVPITFSGFGYEMTTFQRMYNLFLYSLNDFYEYFYAIPEHDAILKKYLPNSPPLSKILQDVDLVLHNSHASSNILMPMLPNTIEIGGFHIENKQLPQDIKKFLDDAVDGAIFFSMGSHLKSAKFPMAKRMAFLKAFSKLKQKVLWKFEEDIDGKPENVMIGKWMPQQDILAHPNLKLFITHCGLLSTIETVHFGVPMLGIPIFADQKMNCAVSKTRDIAQVLDFIDIDEDSLTKSLNELLNNPKYKDNVRFRSAIMRDQETKPMDRAMFWIDYVIRHKGAKHLQTHAIHMSWCEYYMVDIFGIVLLLITISIFTAYYAIRKCRRYMAKDSVKIKKN